MTFNQWLESENRFPSDRLRIDLKAAWDAAQANGRLRKLRRKKKSLPVIVPKSVYLVIYEQCEGFVEVSADPQVIWDACRTALEEVQIDEKSE
ncbi:Uncharacterised protein [Serratia quinivorans]|uniref:hypothetical protein n=1 Tax=Serratia quinivorans TaxID=137545 RepID=UPI0021777336|nr:hypothetical protein [Serratia quinivorans]CAI1527630.1 Uncharacterised protein [Serratia quinivorans]